MTMNKLKRLGKAALVASIALIIGLFFILILTAGFLMYGSLVSGTVSWVALGIALVVTWLCFLLAEYNSKEY